MTKYAIGDICVDCAMALKEPIDNFPTWKQPRLRDCGVKLSAYVEENNLQALDVHFAHHPYVRLMDFHWTQDPCIVCDAKDEMKIMLYAHKLLHYA